MKSLCSAFLAVCKRQLHNGDVRFACARDPKPSEGQSRSQSDVTIDQVKAFFPEIPKDSEKFILTLFNNPVDVVSLTFLHTRFVLDLAEDVVYQARLSAEPEDDKEVHMCHLLLCG